MIVETATGLQARARAFVDEVLIPREVAAERAGGRLPREEVEIIRREALERGLAGGRHATEHGGQGWSALEWFLVEEQFGRSTNALSWHVPNAYNVLAHGTPEQIDRYLRPALRGELQDAYAVTEEHAGSDPSGIRTTATRTPDGWRIDGEKWFVTSGDIADVYVVMAKAMDLPTLFLVDRGAAGIEFVDDPPFTHSYPHGHPTIRFDGVELRGKRPFRIAQQGLALVPQGRQVFASLSVEDNLTLARRKPSNGTEEWTLERLYELFPNLHERRRTRAGQLSGGEQQMLAIGRALMTHPRLVLMDEPSEGLAPVIVEKVREVIEELCRQQLSILLVEQNYRLGVDLASHVYVLANGKVVWDGAPAALDAADDVREEHLGV